MFWLFWKKSRKKNDFVLQFWHERSVLSKTSTRVSFGFSLGVGVWKFFVSPYPLREAKRESRWYEILVWILVMGRGGENLQLAPTPNEKSSESLVDTRISFGISLGVGVWKISVSPYPLWEAKRESHCYEILVWHLVGGRGVENFC